MTTQPEPNSPRVFLTLFLIIVAPLVWMFGPAFWKNEVFAFRDAANFYYPLFHWQCEEWGSGNIPLWNHYDNLGSAAFADATSSVLYPGKLLFCLPCDFALRFNLYIALHILLAAWAAYGFARRWQCSPPAAAMCAISYAYGGYTLFQYANVVFLVGAAWLPVALRLADAMLVERSVRRATAFGAVLAMMTLGGDPQTAYHAGLLAVLHAVLLWWHDRRSVAATPLPFPAGWNAWYASRPALLLVAAAVSFGLAAVQVLPSYAWARRSQRACYDAPRNIYEASETLFSATEWHGASGAPWRTICTGLFGKPPAGTHAAHAYYYSVGPWRWAELIWPNVSGKMFPVHRRWLSALPAEGRVWTPSLYCGLVPLLAAAGAWRWRRGTSQDRWAIIMILLGIGASCGWYGLGWQLHELSMTLSGSDVFEPRLGQPVGGLYWLFMVLLPGYDYFRYPAKWFVVAALGLSFLGARGIDQFPLDEGRARRLAKWVAAVSFLLASVLVSGRSFIIPWLSAAPADNVFGPLDAHGSWFDVVWGVLQTGFVSLLVLAAMRFAFLRPGMQLQTWLLMLTAVDLTLANQWLVTTVPAHKLAPYRDPLAAFGPPNEDQGVKPPSRLTHPHFYEWTPPSWRSTSDPKRMSTIVDWERFALLHKYHLLCETAMLDTSSTLAPAEVQALLRLVNGELERQRTSPRNGSPLLAAVGVEALLESPATFGGPSRTGVPQPGELEMRQQQRIPTRIPGTEPFPRAWLVHDVRPAATLFDEHPKHASSPIQESIVPRKSTAAIEARLRRMWFRDGGKQLRDPREMVFVESRIIPANNDSRSLDTKQESCRIARYESQRVELDVTLSASGMVVLSDLYDGGWQATFKTGGTSRIQTSEVLCVNGLIRGVWLPAGNHRVTLYYQPKSFWVGSICSALTAIAIAMTAVWRKVRP